MKKRKKRHIGLKICLLLLLVAAFLFYDSNTRVEITEYELSFETLPEVFDGFRIVTLSDVHAAEFGDGNEKLLEKVRQANPDIIAVTGDLIDADDQGDAARGLLKGLTDIAQTYYVTGNHEFDSGGLDELMEIIEECGVTPLRNDYKVLETDGGKIVLAGNDDPNGWKDMMSTAELVSMIRKEQGEDVFIAMLSHRNGLLDTWSSLDVPLVFCGHAHGGIVRLPFTDGLIGPNREWLPTYTSGPYYKDNTTMLVSRGVGNHTGYPRFLNNPQVLVAELHTK